MQTKSPPLLPIFRSHALARMLAHLFLRDDPLTLTELARAVDAAPSTVKREVDTLEATGLLRTSRSGRNRVVAPNTDSPLYRDLRSLFLKAFGPQHVLAEALEPVPGVEAAYIFGSWARRYHGVWGPAPRDVDVIVVGDVDPNEVYDACAAAERDLSLDVDATIVTREEWEAAESPLIHNVKERRMLVPLIGNGN